MIKATPQTSLSPNLHNALGELPPPSLATPTVLKNELTLAQWLQELSLYLPKTQMSQNLVYFAKQSIESQLPLFYRFYEGLSQKQQKTLLTQKAKLSPSLKKKIIKEKKLNQLDFEFLSQYPFLSLDNYMAIKEHKNFDSQNEFLYKLTNQSVPKTARTKALDDFMNDYKTYYDNQQLYPIEKLQFYAEKLNFSYIEKTEIPTTVKVRAESKTGKVYMKTKETVKKIKTQEQQVFDKFKKIFIFFALSHIQNDFIELLKVLGLDFKKAFASMKYMKPQEIKDCLLGMEEKIDLKGFFENLKPSEQTVMLQNFFHICATLSGQASFKYLSVKANDPTSPNIQRQWFNAAYALHKKSFSEKQIENVLSVFDEKLKETFSASLNKSGFEAMLDCAHLNKASIQKQFFDKLKAIKEKEKLSIMVPSLNTQKKLKIHKI